MSCIRKITITKTESTPEDAFSNYPHPSPAQFAEFSSKYDVTRTVEETADSLIITLIFPSQEIREAASLDSMLQLKRQQRYNWSDENHIVVTVDNDDV